MIFNKLLAYISLGTSIFGLVPTLAAQVKSPSMLDPAVVWNEVEPILMQIGLATGHQINMDLAQKITYSAVTEIKTYAHPK